MALHLRFSNSHEPLVRELSLALDACWTDFAQPPPVVVPSPAVAKWLKLRLCETRGPLVGLPTPTLEGFLWKSLDPDPEFRILRVDALQQAVIPLLDESRLARAEYAPVRAYLCPAGGVDPKRRSQLAHEVARLFLEYEYNRPSVWKSGAWAVRGIDQSWPDRPYFAGNAPESATESWQRDLHGAVFASDGPLAGSNLLGLPRLHRLRREAGWTSSGGPVMVFGVEKVSHFHRNLLLELSETREIHLFLPNPCAEFWEDVDTSRRNGRKSSTRPPRFSPEDYQAPSLTAAHYPDVEREQDPFLLRRWGGAIRESLVLWSQAVDYDFEFPVEPAIAGGGPATVLAALRQSLLRRHPGPAREPMELDDGRILSEALPADRSVILLECPERGREMEAVRDQVFDWLAEDPARTVSDAVVLMPDPSRHRAAIHRVFGSHAPGEPAHVPWVVLGETAGESRWARAVRSLLALARGQADRPSVFAILRNPLVQDKLRVDAATVARWESWAQMSGMIRGWDAEHRLELGDAPEAALDTHTFKAGWLRLQLSPLAAGAFALGLRTPPGIPERVPTVRDFDSDAGEVDGFGEVLERLFHDARAFAKSCRFLSPSELGARFVAWIDAWTAFGDDAESRVRRELLEGLEHLSIQEKAGRKGIDLDELEELVVSLLSGDLPGSARAFAGSLTFAPLKSGHVLPHGLVVLAGFDADAFPGDGLRTRLDLLAQGKLVGDADPVADNRALFLQAVASAKSRLVVSWRGRDIQRDEQLEPSSVVQELEEALRSVSNAKFRHKMRLLARDAALAGEERAGEEFCSWDPCDRVDPEVPRREPWVRPAEPSDGAVRISVSEVKSFLTDSFLHHARRVMGWRDEESPETLDAGHEALEASKLDDSIWKSELFPRVARLVWGDRVDDVERTVRGFAGSRSWDMAFPEAALAKLALDALVAWAESTAGKLARLREARPGSILLCGADLSLGDPSRPAALELAVDGRAILLTARIAAAVIPRDVTDPVTLLHCAKVDSSRKVPVVSLSRSFGIHLQAMALSRAGIGSPLQVAIFGREPSSEPVLEEARAAPEGWWERILSDLLSDRSEYLPAKTILDLASKDLGIGAVREKLDGSDYADALERLFEPSLPGEESGDEALFMELVRRRLDPFLGETSDV